MNASENKPKTRSIAAADERFLRHILSALIVATLASGSLTVALAYDLSSPNAPIHFASFEP